MTWFGPNDDPWAYEQSVMEDLADGYTIRSVAEFNKTTSEEVRRIKQEMEGATGE